jgi:hypothetical protein
MPAARVLAHPISVGSANGKQRKDRILLEAKPLHCGLNKSAGTKSLLRHLKAKAPPVLSQR